METFVPAPRRQRVLLCMAAALSLAMSLVDGDPSSCTPVINMTGQQNFIKSPGQPLILKCPVRNCYLGLPNVTWCKINGLSCEPLRTGIHYSTEEPKTDIVYVMKFESVQINDTGYYQCKAVYEKQQIVGSTVQIAVSEFVTENLTAITIKQADNTTDVTAQLQTFTLLLYVMSSMGGVCVLIITISLLIYCFKHLKAKQRLSSQDPTPTEELQFVAVSDGPKNCPQYIQGGVTTSMNTSPTAVTAEVTYDNAHMGYKPSTQNVSNHKDEESIVYADLSHNAKKSSFQFVDNDEVEYATVHLNESKK